MHCMYVCVNEALLVIKMIKYRPFTIIYLFLRVHSFSRKMMGMGLRATNKDPSQKESRDTF